MKETKIMDTPLRHLAWYLL